MFTIGVQLFYRCLNSIIGVLRIFCAEIEVPFAGFADRVTSRGLNLLEADHRIESVERELRPELTQSVGRPTCRGLLSVLCLQIDQVTQRTVRIDGIDLKHCALQQNLNTAVAFQLPYRNRSITRCGRIGCFLIGGAYLETVLGVAVRLAVQTGAVDQFRGLVTDTGQGFDSVGKLQTLFVRHTDGKALGIALGPGDGIGMIGHLAAGRQRVTGIQIHQRNAVIAVEEAVLACAQLVFQHQRIAVVQGQAVFIDNDLVLDLADS